MVRIHLLYAKVLRAGFIHRRSFNILSVANLGFAYLLKHVIFKASSCCFQRPKVMNKFIFEWHYCMQIEWKNQLFPLCISFKFVIFLPEDPLFISIKQKLKFSQLIFHHVFQIKWKNYVNLLLAPSYFF